MNYLVIRSGLIILSIANIVVGVANLIISYLMSDLSGQVWGGVMLALGIGGVTFVALEDRK